MPNDVHERLSPLVRGSRETRATPIQIPPATELLRLIEARQDPRAQEVDVDTLLDGVARAQVFRHARADDEEEGLLDYHVKALEALDELPALQILSQSRGESERELYRQAFPR